MYAMVLLACLAGQGNQEVPNRGSVAFGPMTGTYSDWVYAPAKPPKKKSVQQELDGLLAKFQNGPNAARVYRPRRLR